MRSFRARGASPLPPRPRPFSADAPSLRARAPARQGETVPLSRFARLIRLAESPAGGEEGWGGRALRFFHESMPARFTIRAASAARYFVRPYR